LVGDPVLRVSSCVTDISMSPDGRWAIYVQQSIDPQATAVKIIDLQTSRSWTAAVFEGAEPIHLRSAWLNSNGKALILGSRWRGSGLRARDQEHTLFWVDASTRRARHEKVEGQTLGSFPEIYPNAHRPVVVIFGQRVELGTPDEGRRILSEEFVFQVHKLDGELSSLHSFVRETSGPINAYWTNSGSTLVFNVLEKGDQPMNTAFQISDGSLDISRGEFRPTEAAKPDFRLDYRSRESEHSRRTALVKDLWLAAEPPTDEPSAYLASNVELAELSADFRHILYTVEGMLIHRRLESMNLTEFREQQINADQRSAMRSAADIGRGAVLYWRDNGEVFPSSDTFFKRVRPYTKRDESFENFVQTFAGGPIVLGVDTSRTSLGYIDAQFGRAMVMLDGTISWRWKPARSGRTG
jgi:hypothetical protein